MSNFLSVVAFTAAHAQDVGQGAVEIRPLFLSGEHLSIEVFNFSKMPMRLNAATIRFPGPDAASSCAVALPSPVEIGPAGKASAKVSTHSEVMECLGRTPGTAPLHLRELYVLGGADSAQSAFRPPVPAHAQLRPARISYEYSLAGRGFTATAEWQFVVE